MSVESDLLDVIDDLTELEGARYILIYREFFLQTWCYINSINQVLGYLLLEADCHLSRQPSYIN